MGQRVSWRTRSRFLPVVVSCLVAACQSSSPATFAIPTAQILGTASPSAASPIPSTAAATPAGSLSPSVDWPTYLGDVTRTSASSEQLLDTASVAGLVTRLRVPTGDTIASSAAVVGNVAYIGSGDGNEYAIDLGDGQVRWKTFLGQTSNPICYPKTMGVTSSATVADGVLYVGGGDDSWYALSADSGAVLWKVPTGDNAPTNAGGHYNWSSPLIWKGAAYVGIASLCDNPSIRGQLLKVDLAKHAIVATFNVIRSGERGGGIWTSPAVDPKTNTIYVTTGETTVSGQPQAQSILALDAGSLALRGGWQVPPAEAVSKGDSDWSTTPTIFSAGGADLVAAGDKNGMIYAFRRGDVSAGPVWRRSIAVAGQCGVCAEGTFSSMAFSGDRLFAAGGKTTIGGTEFQGSVRALDPATGDPLWEVGLPDPVLPALVYDNGFVVAAAGPYLDVLSAADGSVLLRTPTKSGTYGAPSISGGRIILGLLDGSVWVLAPG